MSGENTAFKDPLSFGNTDQAVGLKSDLLEPAAQGTQRLVTQVSQISGHAVGELSAPYQLLLLL